MSPSRSLWWRLAVALLMVAAALLWGGGNGVAPGVVVLVSVTIALWATSLLPEHWVAAGFLLAALLLSVVPPARLLSGVTAPAFWMVAAGMVIGMAVGRSPLGGRLAGGLLHRVGGGYPGLIAALVGVGVLLGFLFPSSLGRVALLVPVALRLADAAGFQPGSRGRSGVVLAAAFGTHIPPFAILTANVPNLVLAGSAEGLHRVAFGYGDYLLLHFPVLGLLKALLLIVLVVRLFPATLEVRPSAAAPQAPMGRDERRLLLLLGIALLLWTGDAFHPIAPAWVAVGVALLLMAPRWGLLPPVLVARRLGYPTLLFVVAVIGLGVVVADGGPGARLGEALAGLPLSPETPALDFSLLALISALTALLTTLPGVPAVMSPLAGELADLTGAPVAAVLMTQVVGFSTPLFPYQSPPLVLALALAGERPGRAIRLGLALTLFTLLLLLPLDYLWWRWLGWW